ncbi:MAG: class I SAM-dependent methyltransferase [Pseudomonadota bacterium]|nr:class I SAM-dependent methyltransferase [Pseudomonadota bacterium]
MTDTSPRGHDFTAIVEDDPLYDARYFDQELHRDHWFRNNAAKRELRWREVVRMLEPTADDRVLELGCAAGEHALRLAPLCRAVVGIDRAAAAIERATARAAAQGIINAEFLQLDAADLAPFANGSFDKVAAIDFVEHVDDLTLVALLREVRRVLRPAGRLAIFTPCATHYVERLKSRNFVLRQLPGHIAVRDAAAYQRLLPEGGFAIASLYFSPSTYPAAGLLDRWLWNLPMIGPLFRFRLCIVAYASAIA